MNSYKPNFYKKQEQKTQFQKVGEQPLTDLGKNCKNVVAVDYLNKFVSLKV